jgi:sigma-B regulation protein RsbU (phosphoserine phosphatase)
MNPERDESVAPPMTPVPSAPLSPWESADAMAVHSPEPGVLVVDDSEWSRDLILKFLQGLRVPVESATSGEEALRKARAIQPALIISDWMMPGMDGLELCRAIRADRRLSTTHFLILTARSEQEDVVEAFRAGADDFLTKPVNDSELRARVRVGLRLHTLYRAVDSHRLELREAKDRLDEQINEIKTLQADFLPHQFPILGGLAFTAFCRPCTEVGGDYYDVFTLPDGRVCITMADVTGHGARAAVCMAMTRSLTRAAASQMARGHDPAWMLQRLNAWLCDQLADSQFVTMWFGLWNPETGQLHYSRAGHPSGILWPAGQDPILLEDPGVPPLGLFSYSQPPPVEALEIPPGCRFVLYTDGWSESFNPKQELYDDAGFLASLKTATGLSLEQVPEVLLRRLQEFVQGGSLDDDISLLIFERCNPSAAGADA